MAFCSRLSSNAESVAVPPVDGRTSSTTTLPPWVAVIGGHSTRAAAAIPGSRVMARERGARALLGILRGDRRRRHDTLQGALLIQEPAHDDIVDLGHAILVDRWPIGGHAAAQ